jgi:hypothetical protein
MSKLDRFKKLPGSKTSVKKAAPSELSILVKELQAITSVQQQSQADIAAAIKQLSQVVMSATKEGFDVSKIVDAITGLQNKVEAKNARQMPLDYQINFDRDSNGLMKTGIKLVAVPKRLN